MTRAHIYTACFPNGRTLLSIIVQVIWEKKPSTRLIRISFYFSVICNRLGSSACTRVMKDLPLGGVTAASDCGMLISNPSPRSIWERPSRDTKVRKGQWDTCSHVLHESVLVINSLCFRSFNPQCLLESRPDFSRHPGQWDFWSHGSRSGQTCSADAGSQWGRAVGPGPASQTASCCHWKWRSFCQVSVTSTWPFAPLICHHIDVWCLSVSDCGVFQTTPCLLAATWKNRCEVFPSIMTVHSSH